MMKKRASLILMIRTSPRTNDDVGEDPSYDNMYHTGVMSILEWLNRFGNTSVDFLEVGVSDHSPALVTIESAISSGPKPFKFFNFWAEHSLFMDWIEEGWRTESNCYSMFNLYTKLNSVKKIVKLKYLECFGGLRQRVRQAKQELDAAQAQFLASHDNVECQLM